MTTSKPNLKKPGLIISDVLIKTILPGGPALRYLHSISRSAKGALYYNVWVDGKTGSELNFNTNKVIVGLSKASLLVELSKPSFRNIDAITESDEWEICTTFVNCGEPIFHVKQKGFEHNQYLLADCLIPIAAGTPLVNKVQDRSGVAIYKEDGELSVLFAHLPKTNEGCESPDQVKYTIENFSDEWEVDA